MRPTVRRAIALLAIASAWVVAGLVAFASLLTAYLGRANWGDGADPEPWPQTLAWIAIALAALAAAAWVTRSGWTRTRA